MKSTKTLIVGCVSVIGLMVAAFGFVSSDSTPANAFGTVKLVGTKQRVVHEPITRSLACDANDPVVNCFQTESIDVLAGRNGTFGGVGEPDNPLDGFPNPAARHCDDIDSGNGTWPTPEEVQIQFDNCRAWYQAYMNFAVESAGELLNPDGSINPSQTDIVNFAGSTYNSCKFPDSQKGHTSDYSAKCKVLGGFGRALHNYEDVWSHSNWGDVADPAKPIDLTNPIGLGNTEQPSFMSFPGPVSVAVPTGFLSGCDDSLPLNSCSRTIKGSSSGSESSTTEVRTSHSMVNKDNGAVDPTTCVASDPLTTRGKIVVDNMSNFQRAITGACGAARKAWADLQSAIIAKYGQAKATNIIRAISFDHPTTQCTVSGSAAKAQSPPVGEQTSARVVVVFLENRTSQSMSCGDAILNGGEWASYPPNTVGARASASWRTQSNGFATGTEGRVTLRLGTDNSVVDLSWNNPYLGSSSFACTAPSGYTCSQSGGSGNNTTITFTLTGP